MSLHLRPHDVFCKWSPKYFLGISCYPAAHLTPVSLMAWMQVTLVIKTVLCVKMLNSVTWHGLIVDDFCVRYSLCVCVFMLLPHAKRLHYWAFIWEEYISGNISAASSISRSSKNFTGAGLWLNCLFFRGTVLEISLTKAFNKISSDPNNFISGIATAVTFTSSSYKTV